MKIKQNITHFIHTQKQKKKVNGSDIDDVFKPVYTAVISNIQRFLGKGSAWIIDRA